MRHRNRVNENSKEKILKFIQVFLFRIQFNYIYLHHMKTVIIKLICSNWIQTQGHAMPNGLKERKKLWFETFDFVFKIILSKKENTHIKIKHLMYHYQCTAHYRENMKSVSILIIKLCYNFICTRKSKIREFNFEALTPLSKIRHFSF